MALNTYKLRKHYWFDNTLIVKDIEYIELREAMIAGFLLDTAELIALKIINEAGQLVYSFECSLKSESNYA
jgi:hypothetical protein